MMFSSLNTHSIKLTSFFLGTGHLEETVESKLLVTNKLLFMETILEIMWTVDASGIHCSFIQYGMY